MNLGQWIGLIALLVSLYILWQIRQVILLVFMAVVFATALNRLVRRMRQSGAKRNLAAVLSVSIFLGILVALFWLIIPSFIEQFQQLAELVPRGLERVQNWAIFMENKIPNIFFNYVPRIERLLQQIQPFVSWAFNNFFFLFSNFFLIILNLLLVLVLTIMFLIKPQPYRQGFVLLFPSFYRSRVNEILSLSAKSL